MTKNNAELIGKLFNKLVRYESFSITNIIDSKYIKMQVEIEVSKPLPIGFFHKWAKGEDGFHSNMKGCLTYVERNCATS